MALNINQTQLDSYNKQTNKGKGTLVSNWHEEAQLREDTGHGRQKPFQHLPKKHYDLFHKLPEEVKTIQDAQKHATDTMTRLFGHLAPDHPNPSSKHYGTTVNRADQVPKVGKRYQIIQQQFINQINQEINQKEKEDFEQSQQRIFQTTVGVEFSQKDIDHQNVGKRVMRNQNGQHIDPSAKDVDLLCDQGFLQKQPISTDEQLRSILQEESYLTAKPITVYAEKYGDGTFYGSGQVHEKRPFHKSDQFAKEFPHFSHIKH